jgi:hypothetical protein
MFYAFRLLDEKVVQPAPVSPGPEFVVNVSNSQPHLCLGLLGRCLSALTYPLQDVLSVLAMCQYLSIVHHISVRTLSSLSFVTTTLEAAMGMGTDWPECVSSGNQGIMTRA